MFSTVTVIMPVYNGHKYLDEAITSVINQTFSEWSLLIIDDGSSDDSLAISRKWEKTDSRIYSLWHPSHANKGVSASRNLGILSSDSDFIALLDCDDTWQPHKLETQLKIFSESHETGISYSQVQIIDEYSMPIFQNNHNKNIFFLTGVVGSGDSLNPVNIFESMVLDKAWMPCSSVIFRRSVIAKAGLFNTSLKYQCEDHLLFTSISYHTKATFVEQPLVCYRIHSGSYSVQQDWRSFFVEYYGCLASSLGNRAYAIIDKGIVSSFMSYISYIQFSGDNGKVNGVAVVVASLYFQLCTFSSIKTRTKAVLLVRLVSRLVRLYVGLMSRHIRRCSNSLLVFAGQCDE